MHQMMEFGGNEEERRKKKLETKRIDLHEVVFMVKLKRIRYKAQKVNYSGINVEFGRGIHDDQLSAVAR